MKRLPLFATSVLAVLLFAGCSHIPFIGKKSHDPSAPKQTSKIATETETEFELRWVTKRSSELVSQGMTADAAQIQATAEFKERFSATHPAQR